MKRSHRLLKEVHRLRRDRFAAAAYRGHYDPYVECAWLQAPIDALRRDGYIDTRARYHRTVAVAEAVLPCVLAEVASGAVGRAIVAAAFTGRRTADGRLSFGGSDRPMAEGCAALAEAAVLDRVFRAFGEAMRRRALVDHRDDPCWPQAYLERFAAAEDARLGLSAGAGADEEQDGVSEARRADGDQATGVD